MIETGLHAMTPAAESMNPLYVSAIQGDLPPLWFLAPEGFFALPVATTVEERAERARSFVQELYSRGDETIWESAALYYTAIAESMGETGVSYAAMGLFSTAGEADIPESNTIRYEPTEGVAQCSFTVAIVATDHDEADTDVVAQGILATLADDPYNDAVWLDLPCGPAVSCVTMREYMLAPELTASGEKTTLLTGQIQVHVPFPTGPYTAVFTLCTASLDHWTEIYRLLSALLQTVSFVAPAE
ncbi:hypothetical protein [Streptomyces sp. NPDC006999]|uniref:hypothetical protein n=1 Tax=Streptomyces sp. NPDC006999 TaxID=3156909 RepID=UPI0033FF3044